MSVRLEDNANKKRVIKEIEKQGLPLDRLKSLKIAIIRLLFKKPKDSNYWTFIYVINLSLSDTLEKDAAKKTKSIEGVEVVEISLG